jgi:hypothetical protein
MKNKIRIASGQGFWGDLQNAPRDQVRKGPIDYLVMDYLAEVTMSILQKQKMKDPALGYAKDLVPLFEEILPDLVQGGIKAVTNGGGVNPVSCREAIFAVAKKLGIFPLTIGIVHGDDILDRLDRLIDSGIPLNHMESGLPLESIRKNVISANVYFGAFPIAEALNNGAQIVITGRTTDTGLTLAPMIHEFNWQNNEWNKLAAGTIAGHILECGAQATGGNFSADWRSVPDLAHVGFPIAEASPDGSIVITKHDGTGGIVTKASVTEQLVYEIGDPANYITPDCVADFTTIQLSDQGSNRILVTSVRGKKATEFYKVSIAYLDGYSAFGTLTYTWPDAVEKAKMADLILRERLRNLGGVYDEIRTEIIGYDSSFGPLAGEIPDANEVLLRIGVRSHDRSAVERFGREIAPLILTGPPSVTGFAGGRPKPSEVVAYWPALIPKSAITPIVTVETR